MPLAPLRKISNARRQSTHAPQSSRMVDGSSSNPLETLRPGTANLPYRTPSTTSAKHGHSLAAERDLSPRCPGDSTTRRFSLMRFRFASDTQLATQYREGESGRGPSPTASDSAPAPTIGITAPPSYPSSPHRKNKRKFKPPFATRSSNSSVHNKSTPASTPTAANKLLTPDYANSNLSFEDSSRPSASSFQESSVNDEETPQQPALSLPRHSESSVPTRATLQSNKFLKFARRKKKPKSLFPLPAKLDPPAHNLDSVAKSNNESPALFNFPAARPSNAGTFGSSQTHLPRPNAPVLAPSSVDFSIKAPPLIRHHSTTSARSSRSVKSTPANVPSLGQNQRARSGTLNSAVGYHEDGNAPTPNHQESGRNSMASTTLGRNSIVGIRSLTSRFRQHSDVNSRSHGSPGSGLGTANTISNNNSFAISRETLVVPERQEGETSGKYYNRLEKDFPKGSIALVFSKTSDDFSHDVLRSLMRTFKFYEEPLDLSLRRFLWEIKLPGESQQIDRVISSFAERYHECNPHIFGSLDEAYFAAYSLIILHSDLFNKNNKNKMQRHEYQKNTGGQGIADEILGYFYDNINYAQFIGQDEEEEGLEGSSKLSKRKRSRPRPKPTASEPQKGGKVDPYDVILSEKTKLDILRPSIREILNLEDTYNCQGTAERIDLRAVRAAFLRYGVLQVVSARSRPEAFTSPNTTSNPEEAQPGVVNFKVAKAGTLWRKDSKKRKTRSPWQEWGVVLTASQIFFFRDAGWVRSLVHQFEQHQKHGAKGTPVVFKPPLHELNADLKLSLFKTVALQDFSYKKHKHAFILTRSGSSQNDSKENFFEEVLLADNETDLNDWIAKLNFAATFTTTGINMHSSVNRGGAEPKTFGEAQAPPPSTVNPELQLARQINIARKDTISQRLTSLDGCIKGEEGKLEEHLKIARHLEILAPFPAKTRTELLSFGARLSLTIKWCRFEVWRLKSHRNILAKDLEEQEQDPSQGDHAPPSPAAAASKPSALGRLNSKATAIIHAQRASKPPKMSSSRLSASSLGNASKDSDLAGGIDKAFATPSDTLSKLTTPVDGPFRLPPLSLGSGNLDRDLYTTSSAITEPIRSRGSISSLRSGTTQSNGDDNLEEVLAPPTPTIVKQDDSTIQDEKLSSGVDSDRELSSTLGSPESRARSRRSLHKTLRDSKELQVPQHQRSKRAKDSSTAADGSTPGQYGGRISRGAGSFTVHGKKASVITLGTEWQQMSAEERLRLRKQSQNRNSKDSYGADPTTFSIGDDSNDNGEPNTQTNGMSTVDINDTIIPKAIEEHTDRNIRHRFDVEEEGMLDSDADGTQSFRSNDNAPFHDGSDTKESIQDN